MKIVKILTYITLVVALLGWGKLAEAADGFQEPSVKTYPIEDGVSIAIHYYRAELGDRQSSVDQYTDAILEYAKEAYNQIVHGYGFDAPGFTYSNPDKGYCYDQDKTIDIYVGDQKMRGALGGFSGSDFLDAPCYDIVRGEGNDYDAVILFPSDYKGYITGADKKDFTDSESLKRMRATLFHEIFHIVTYSYNKNIKPWYERYKDTTYYKGGDWYVEGLARYFETKADSYDNFFSEGSTKKVSGKKMIYQEGANYLMKHPSESLKDARYDYSLFWAYIEQRFSMKKIEELSRKLRFISADSMEKDLPRIFSKVMEEDFESLIKEFAVAMYFKYFNPDIKRGLNDLKVMTLDDFSNDTDKKIGSWASNFIKLTLNSKNAPSVIKLKKTKSEGELKVTIFAGFSSGKIKEIKKLALSEADVACEMQLVDMKRSGVENLILIITNTNQAQDTGYRILQS